MEWIKVIKLDIVRWILEKTHFYCITCGDFHRYENHKIHNKGN